MCSILVTGATGYLGSKLCSHLVKSGYKLSILTREPDNYYNIFSLPKDRIYNTTILNAVEKLNDYDIILHCATLYKSSSTLELADVNIGFPIKVANKFLSKNGLFINIDTSLDPKTNDYAYSKNLLVQLLTKIAQSDDIRVINLELQYFFDENEPDDRFVKSLIKACLQNKDFILTKGDQIRDFIHLDDLIQAVVLVLNSTELIRENFKNIEIGSGKGVSIKNFANKIKKITKSKSKFDFGSIPYRDNETMHSVADISELEYLGWQPRYNLLKALELTIEKIKQNQ